MIRDNPISLRTFLKALSKNTRVKSMYIPYRHVLRPVDFLLLFGNFVHSMLCEPPTLFPFLDTIDFGKSAIGREGLHVVECFTTAKAAGGLAKLKTIFLYGRKSTYVGNEFIIEERLNHEDFMV